MVVLAFLILFSSVQRIDAGESFSEFHYLTHFERTVFDEIIWFWTYDTLYGPVHSNDYIGIKYSPHFTKFSTSAPDFIRWGEAHPRFGSLPQFGAPIRNFPRQFNVGREDGQVFEDDDGRLM